MAEATPDVLALHTAADPEKTAIIDGDRVMNRRDFNALVNQYAAVMLDAKVVAGEKVLWVGQNSLEVVAINHAARKVGAVCVPMNYRLAPDEAQYVIDNCDAVVVLYDVEQEAQLEGAREACPTVRHWLSFRTGDLERLAADASTDEPRREGDDPAAGT